MSLRSNSKVLVVLGATVALLVAGVTTAVAARDGNRARSASMQWTRQYCQELQASGVLATTTHRKAFCAKRYGIVAVAQPPASGPGPATGGASGGTGGSPSGTGGSTATGGRVRGFAKRVTIGSTTSDDANTELTEVSGIDASLRYQGFFWVHNDSGDSARIFLIDDQARHRATVTFQNVGAGGLDLEDIAVGPGPSGEAGYIYVGDIGNNDAARSNCCTILRLVEPDLTLPETGVATATVNVEKMRFDYRGEGNAAGRRDAEALMVDPRTNHLFVISKTTSQEAPSNLYELVFTPGATNGVAQYVKTIAQRGIVSADISAGGGEIIIKNYQKVFFWQRDTGQTVGDALAAKPVNPPYSQLGERQGEAIAFVLDADQRQRVNRDRQGFYTMGEAKNASLYFYQAQW